jgi:hypothetical protein
MYSIVLVKIVGFLEFDAGIKPATPSPFSPPSPSSAARTVGTVRFNSAILSLSLSRYFLSTTDPGRLERFEAEVIEESTDERFFLGVALGQGDGGSLEVEERRDSA